jgi:DNA-damage-inducible protein D
MSKEIMDFSNSPFEKIKKINEYQSEYWSAREFYKLLDYSRWEKFLNVVDKAKESCKNSSQQIEDHFHHEVQMVEIGSGAERELDDVLLSRYACYLIIQNADPSKEVVAHGQTYFAYQTRKQEVTEEALEAQRRLLLRQEMKEHNKKLADAAKEVGVKEPIDYAIFQDYGYMGLYGGLKSRDIHAKKGLKKSQSILDHMGSTELAANLFRATQAEEKLRKDKSVIKGKQQANTVHYEVGKKVRQTIAEISGTMPEDLPTAESIKKLEKEEAKRLQNKSESSEELE